MMAPAIRHFEITDRTVFLSDLDGTVLKLLSDPSKRRVDNDAFHALNLFNKHFPGHVVPITGRDYEQVQQCFAGHKLPFPVITSNGAELQTPDGNTYTYQFRKDEISFMQEAREKFSEFSKKNPWLVVEVKRWEVGYHSSMAAGYREKGTAIETILDRVRGSAEEAGALLVELEDKAKRLRLDFAIAGAEQTHHALSPSNVNKLAAIDFFSSYLPSLPKGRDWSHVVYCGDGLLAGKNGCAAGNDRQIAEMVRKNGGVVIQVINSASLPEENDSAEPHLAVEWPNELGNLLRRRVSGFFKERNALRCNFKG